MRVACYVAFDWTTRLKMPVTIKPTRGALAPQVPVNGRGMQRAATIASESNAAKAMALGPCRNWVIKPSTPLPVAAQNNSPQHMHVLKPSNRLADARCHVRDRLGLDII